jgi:ABC-type nitrate/sulfonate/bicarbonate transport system substrate-binding protein
MVRRIGLLLGLSLVVLPPAHAQAPAQAPATATSKTVDVLVQPGLQIFPLAIMKLRGFDRKHDLSLQEQKVAGVQGALTRIINSQFNVAFQPWATVAVFRQRGIGVINTDSLSRFSHSVVVKADSRFGSWRDLKGAKVGLSGGAAAAATHIFRYEMIKFVGLNNDDYELKFGEPGLLGAQLERGDVDAALLLEPLSSQFIAGGKYRAIGGLGDAYKAGTGKEPPPYINVIMNEAWAKANRDLARRFLQALRESQEFLRDNPSIWPELAREIGITDPKEIEVLRQRVAPTIITEWNPTLIAAQDEFLRDIARVLPKKDLAFPAEPPAGWSSLDYAPQ